MQYWWWLNRKLAFHLLTPFFGIQQQQRIAPPYPANRGANEKNKTNGIKMGMTGRQTTMDGSSSQSANMDGLDMARPSLWHAIPGSPMMMGWDDDRGKQSQRIAMMPPPTTAAAGSVLTIPGIITNKIEFMYRVPLPLLSPDPEYVGLPEFQLNGSRFIR